MGRETEEKEVERLREREGNSLEVGIEHC